MFVCQFFREPTVLTPDPTLMHEEFMRLAIEEAEAAMAEDEVPVGAVIVHEGRIIARAHNQREQLRDPTAHAEMVAITQAAESRQSWRLDECVLYVTLEPCPMCAGAILQARLPVVVYGAADPKAGAVRTLYHLLDDPRLNHRCLIVSGVLVDECGAILSRFFRQQRSLGKK
jgi:tRNA(adenine34) deaminase